jgi:hypothetical protein
VIVLTTLESDIVQSYTPGAPCYITKPPNLDGFFVMGEAIHHFWLDAIELSSNLGSDPNAFNKKPRAIL